MSIQSFTERLISVIEKDFEVNANNLVNEARQRTGKESYIVGVMDGLSRGVALTKETYTLFVKSDNEPEGDDAKSLY